LRVAVANCWTLGAVSTEVMNTTVVVGFDMTRDGRPVVASMQMLSFEGGGRAAADIAYRTARSAIVRCTGDGYDLPTGKYEQWKRIEMTFNPQRMRSR